MPQITVDMTDEDFDLLCFDAGHWDRMPGDLAERFPPVGSALGTAPGEHWAAIYWIGDSWSSVMLARAYLVAQGEDFEIVHDEAVHPNGTCWGYAILTDYICPKTRALND